MEKTNLPKELFMKLAQDNIMFGAYLLPRNDGFSFDGTFKQPTSKKGLPPKK